MIFSVQSHQLDFGFYNKIELELKDAKRNTIRVLHLFVWNDIHSGYNNSEA